MKYEDLSQNAEIMDELNSNKELAYFNNDKNRNISVKKKVAKNLLLILLFVFTFYTMFLLSTTLNGGAIAELGDVMAHTRTQYFLVAVIITLVLFLTDTLKYCILSKMTVGKTNPFTCFKVGVIGKFYDNITPFSSGGQPFQIVYMSKKHYPIGMATAIPSIKYIIQLYSWIIVSIILYIVNSQCLSYLNDPAAAAFLSFACYIGLLFAISAPTLLAFFALMPKSAHKLVSFMLRFFKKIRLIKNYDKAHAKVMKFIQNYQSAFAQISKQGIRLILLGIFCALDFILYLSLPYFLLISMGGAAPSWQLLFDVITLNSYSFFAASLMPTPGNSGAIEASYAMVFAPVLVSQGTLFWIVFAWRFFTYYIYIILGILYNAISIVKKRLLRKFSDLDTGVSYE